jgi:hypothetical protein
VPHARPISARESIASYESDFSPAIFVTAARRCTRLRARVLRTMCSIHWHFSVIAALRTRGTSLALRPAAVFSNSI